MDIVSLCPLRATSMVWQPARGRWTLTVVCKATYRLLPEVSPLHEEQEYPIEEDSHWDDDPHRSLSAPTDLVPFKAKAEVLLVGQAFAPRKQPVRSLVARMIVGNVDKSIEVFGKRAFSLDGQFWEGPGFTSMPLVYERAAGGPGTWNPSGMRLDGPADAQGRVAIPHLQPLGMVIKSGGEPMPAIGFGPIAPTWPERSQRIERHRGVFSPAAWREQPMPVDLDPAYFNAAPPDQQLDALRPDERIVLENLHPEHPRLIAKLPGVRPRVFAEESGSSPREVEMRCDTLWIDTDRGICTLTWRGHVPLDAPVQAGRVLIALEERGQQLSWADVARLGEGGRGYAGEQQDEAFSAAEAPRDIAMSTGMFSPELAAKPVLPFQEQAGGSEQAPRSRDAEGGLPLIPVSGPSGAPPAPPPLVRAAVTGGPSAPAVAASPWAARGAQGPGTTIGQAVLASPDVLPSAPGIVGAPAGKEAVPGGAVAASGAAGAVSRVIARAAPAAPRAEAQPAARTAPREVLELIWYDPAALPRIRRHLGWKKIIAELKPRPSDDDFDGGLPPEQMKAAKDKRDVFGVLARGEVQDMAGIRRAMEMAIAEDGSFVPPYVLTAGTLEFPFDEVETLKAMLVVVAPFVPGDKKLKETVELANEVLRTPGLDRARGVTERPIARLKEAFEQASRDLPAGYLEVQIEPMLLDGRCYQRRAVRGGTAIRATIAPASAIQAIPTWLPVSMEKELPLSRMFRVRAIVEARWPVDEFGTTSLEAYVLALGRQTVQQ
ncbi:DUF2169 domain-containing protein [Sorangium sp. So ce291]|uniref:DUF2169 family type VI secretion system accessory protein n=1 Tax=Sorangium sp. So ce291 TaxID=3133294 RepID=UPI003F629ECE